MISKCKGGGQRESHRPPRVNVHYTIRRKTDYAHCTIAKEAGGSGGRVQSRRESGIQNSSGLSELFEIGGKGGNGGNEVEMVEL